jgi:hypothetical protein
MPKVIDRVNEAPEEQVTKFSSVSNSCGVGIRNEAVAEILV